MVDSFSVPESLLVEEQQLLRALDAEDHVTIDQSSHCLLTVIPFSEHVLQTDQLQVADLRLSCRNLPPNRYLLIHEFLCMRQQLHLQH